jgi:hypothetical protein
MSLQRTPLSPSQLSPAAQKALGAGPVKMMAARGLAPLPRPAELVSVLYQLGLDGDAKISQAAAKTAAELPDKVLTGALADTSLDARVLDYFAEKVSAKPQLIELVILNPSTADVTIQALAGKLGQREIDLIGGNEERLLRHPAIIGAMYMNRAARMSTVDRAVELAVRNDVKVPGIPAWEEVARAVVGVAQKQSSSDAVDVDDLFAMAASLGSDGDGDERADPDQLRLSQMTVPMKLRLATLGNKFIRGELIRDTNKMVALAAIKAPGVTEVEATQYAGNNSLCEDVINYISRQREWTKLYPCKVNLVNNPKTPLPTAMKLITHLRDRELRTLARSKGVSSALTAQARKLVATRSTGKGN